MTTSVLYYAHKLLDLKESKASPYMSVLLLTIFDMIEDGSIYENHIVFNASLECAYEDAWSRYVGGQPNTTVVSAVWNLSKLPLCELHAEHEMLLRERKTCPSANQMKELGGWLFLQDDFYQVLQTTQNRAKLRQLLITNNICVVNWSHNEDEVDTVYLEEYDEVCEENDALKKRLVELRTELSNTKKLLLRATNGEKVTYSDNNDELKQKDLTIDKLNAEVRDLKSKNENLKDRLQYLRESYAELSVENEKLENRLHDALPSDPIRGKQLLAEIESLKESNNNKDSVIQAQNHNIAILKDELRRTKEAQAANKLSYQELLKFVEVETIRSASSIPYDDWISLYKMMNQDAKASSFDNSKIFLIASKVKLNHPLFFVEAYEALAIYHAYHPSQQGKDTSPQKVAGPKPTQTKASAHKVKETEKTSQEPGEKFLGLDLDQWRAAYKYDLIYGILTAGELTAVRIVLSHLAKNKSIPRSKEAYASKALQALKSHGFDPNSCLSVKEGDEPLYQKETEKAPTDTSTRNDNALNASVGLEDNGNLANDRLQNYKKHFRSLHVSHLLGTPSPHKPVMLIAVMNLIERGYYRTTVITPGEVLEREFEAVWHLMVPPECKYTCIYWTPFWYMRSEPFWTMIPRLGVDLPKKGWMPEYEAREKITGARIDQELFDLLVKGHYRNELKQVLVETYLSKKQR